jgi:hypothetical protein
MGNLVEWSSSLHLCCLAQQLENKGDQFAGAASVVAGNVSSIAFLHSISLGLSNAMALFNRYESHKLIPTTIIGICDLGYIVYRLTRPTLEYPVLFFIHHFPGTFLSPVLKYGLAINKVWNRSALN